MHKRIVALWSRLSYATLTAIAIAGLAAISYRQFAGIAVCPTFAKVPACYVLLMCYLLVFASAFLTRGLRGWIFWPGWATVMIAAAVGSSLEIAGDATCPRSSGGMPTCYYSLALAALILGMYLLSGKMEKDACRHSNSGFQ